MTAISSVGNSAALVLLQQKQSNSSASTFLSSGSLSTSSDGTLSAINDAFSSNKDLQTQFNAAYKAWMQRVEDGKSDLQPDNAKHNALTEVITANRDSFPPEEFVIRTELPDGASISTTIPSAASIKAETFKATIAEKQSQYDADVAAQASDVDDGAVKLNALSKIVETLTLDSQDTALLLFDLDSASEPALAHPFFQ